MRAAWTSTDVPLGSPITTAVLDARVFNQHGLNVLGKDVLAAGEDDHVLNSALDVEKAILVEVAEVAGLVPPIFRRPWRFLRGRCSSRG